MRETEAIRKRLLDWFKEEARDLPFRRTRDPYLIWLSEIILQQTRVDQGLPYYERFVAAYPTVTALADAPEEAVLKLWEGLGYYTRARNLHAAAREIRDRHDGKFPDTARLLQMLPGVGRYTAGAVASIAFGERVPVVDGNVKRVLARLRCIADPVDDPTVEEDLWAIAEELVPARHPGDFNQAMMELGARVCTPRQPRCDLCPLAEMCAARIAGVAESLPVKRARKEVPQREMVVAVIQRGDGCYLIGRRPSEGLLGGLWEFPGGALAPRETHQQALRRACQEVLGVEVRVGGLVACVRHAYTHFKVTLNVYRCDIEQGEPQAKQHTELRWIAPGDFGSVPFPKANHKFLSTLAPSEPDLFSTVEE